MSEHSSPDIFEPSLLDRLLDDERTTGEVAVLLDPKVLAEHDVTAERIFRLLERRGWQKVTAERASLSATFHVSRAEANPARCRAIEVPVGDNGRKPLEHFGEISVHFISNSHLENPEQRRLSARRLRDAITRDLGWLLNTLSLDATQDLAGFPAVRTAVVNYGMPSFAGRAVSSIDVAVAAQRIETAIAAFEPRLRGVRVVAGRDDESGTGGELKFEIEAEMWSYPSMQRVVLDTRIDTDSGNVSVVDRG